MAGKKTRTEPNRADPLSEKTLGRRLWAAYLSSGYKHESFARAIDVHSTTLYKWEEGQATPDLELLIKARLLVHFTLDELVFGRDSNQVTRHLEPSLVDLPSIIAVLDELNADEQQRAALNTYRHSEAGEVQRITRSFIEAFISVFSEGIANGQTRATAIAEAKVAGHRARALADTVAAKGRLIDVSKLPKPKPSPDDA